MRDKKIKWCAIQPLTGGMYLGTEKAVGCPAEFILTYSGNGDPIYDKKTNELNGGGNEYHLMTYLDKVGRRPEYKMFNRKMFQNDNDMNPEILNHDYWTLNPDKDLDYSNMDLCVAVPVCSGLSTATIGSDEAKELRNCNMIWISKYALKVINPNIYIFENAPTFMGARGDKIRVQLEALAKETGYSIVYYRTDTQYHDNCQKRKRTFIIFFKKEFAPQMQFEHIECNSDQYLSRISKNATQQEPLDFNVVNYVNMFCIDYLKEQFGTDWRNNVENIFQYIIKNKLFNEVLNYVDNCKNASDKQKEQMHHFVNHVTAKLAANRGFYHALPFIPRDGKLPAVMFKMMQSCLHPHEDRLLSIRECLHLMGHPDDYELQGKPLREYPKIGQNVPVRTAYWIVSEALRAFNRDNELDEQKKIRFFDNIKQEELKY